MATTGAHDDELAVGDEVFDPDTNTSFAVGGREKKLTPRQQLDQLTWYFSQHYPCPDTTAPWRGGTTSAADIDSYMAKIPDRLTHASMLMLGSALNHRMPGVEFTVGHDFSTTQVGDKSSCVISPDNARDTWIVTAHGGGLWHGSGSSLEFYHRPDMAGLAALSQAHVIDVDYPLAPDHTARDMVSSVRAAVDYARQQGATNVTGYGVGCGAALIAAVADQLSAMVLDRARLNIDELPEHLRAGVTIDPAAFPARTLFQRATNDECVSLDPRLTAHAQVRDYLSAHIVSTPQVARQRLREAAEFLNA